MNNFKIAYFNILIFNEKTGGRKLCNVSSMVKKEKLKIKYPIEKFKIMNS